jgi:hypothetical protein
VLFSSRLRAAEVEVLRQSGPADKRFNIAVLGDGYRVEDQALLRQNAQAIIDYVFGVSPLQQYAQFFNVKLVHVISNQNGADNGSEGAERDTALGAYFNCDNIDRLLCIDDAKTQIAAAQDVPEYNFAIVLVNDPKYGGSGGPVCVSSSNEQSFEVLAHELGHSLAGLADEYSYQGNQPACDALRDCPEANATVRSEREQIKWKAWIESGTPVPTPATSQYFGVTGLFEGARYTPQGVYRPEEDCKMRDLGAPYCTVCSEQFVRAIWSAENVQMIESTVPSLSHVTIPDCAALELSLQSPPISPSSYTYGWSIDGAPLDGATNAAQVVPALLGAGDHDVRVTVTDSTALVRNDPHGLLHDSFSWKVSVARDDCVTTPGGSGGASGAGGNGGTGGGAGVGGVAGYGGVPSGGDAGSVGGLDEHGGASGSGATCGANAGGSGATAGTPVSEGGAAGSGGVPLQSGAPAGGATGAAGALSGGGNVSTDPPQGDRAGCGCAVPGSSPRDWASLLGVAGAAVLLRRRAQR